MQYITRNNKIYSYLWINGIYPIQSYNGNYIYKKTKQLNQLLEKYEITNLLRR